MIQCHAEYAGVLKCVALLFHILARQAMENFLSQFSSDLYISLVDFLDFLTQSHMKLSMKARR